MSINIAVNTTESLQSYLADYQTNFGNSKWGGFNSWNPFATSGTQYANGEGNVFNSGNTSKRGFVAEGNLNYTLFSNPSHTLYGQLDTLKLGTGLQGVSNRNLANEKFSITGLNLNSAKSEGRNGDVHKIVYGLMKPKSTKDGNKGVEHLEKYLNENNLNLTGDAQANQLQGYNGNDTLTGGAGNDTFIFKGYSSDKSVNPNTINFGNDTITDYQTGEVIKIASGASYNTTIVNGNAVIDVTNGAINLGTITVNGVTDVNDLTIQAVA